MLAGHGIFPHLPLCLPASFPGHSWGTVLPAWHLPQPRILPCGIQVLLPQAEPVGQLKNSPTSLSPFLSRLPPAVSEPTPLTGSALGWEGTLGSASSKPPNQAAPRLIQLPGWSTGTLPGMGQPKLLRVSCARASPSPYLRWLAAATWRSRMGKRARMGLARARGVSSCSWRRR